jgi:hypothetical protein
MNCMPSAYEADTVEESLPEKQLHAALAQEGRNRQAAALYLHAATMTDDAVKRKVLRRRAAELILPRLGDRGQRLAC